ncbi:MAG: alpha-D-ribose 1-methylphosphonate 5-triphosphate diphosphatase [Inquilinaceae bacterium]
MRDVPDRPLSIVGGRILTPDGLEPGSIHVFGGRIVPDRPSGAAVLDARGALVLPGIVDVHGDAFERNVMPRPRVGFDVALALAATDRELIAHGVTTAFHGLSVSWEPGLRSVDNARVFVSALRAIRPRLRCDTRLHVRWETFALDARAEILDWLRRETGSILAFNDHTTGTVQQRAIARKLDTMAARSGVTPDEYRTLVERVWARRHETPAAIDAMAADAGAAGVILLAHDERCPTERAAFRDRGAIASEFPLTLETARAARDAGEHVVLGAPNVIRGGSHTGALDATDAIRDGLCTVLASDYFYPAPLHAAFALVRDKVMALPDAWALVSRNAADVAGLADRGVLEPGRRADIVVVDDADPSLPHITAVVAGGTPVYGLS